MDRVLKVLRPTCPHGAAILSEILSGGFAIEMCCNRLDSYPEHHGPPPAWQVGEDWIVRIFKHASRLGHMRVGWANLLAALVLCGRFSNSSNE
jgi:hypothetical protein